MNPTNPKQPEPSLVGLFGGTFNPVHRGHLSVAQEIRQSFGLDRLVFIPCALPPHKLRGPLAPANDRMEMIRRAIEGIPHLEVSDIEVQRSGTSYTIDTLRAFSRQSSEKYSLYFLLGLDAFLEIHTWKAYQQLLDMTAMIVMSRPMPGRKPRSLQEAATVYAQTYLSDQYQPSGNGAVLRHPTKRSIYLARVTPMDIASTRIREQIARKAAVDQWITPEVAQYIDKKGLYR